MGRRLLSMAMGSAFILGAVGCRLDMQDAPRYDPFEESKFFADGMASRHPIAGTVALGELNEDTLLFTGQVDGTFSDVLPFAMTKADLDRGEERYNIFCSPCHARTGDGNGMIVQRGFKAPPSFHEARMQTSEVGYFFDVITNGFGVMYDYKSRIRAEDRWRIAAYIKTLQFSRNATLADVQKDQQWLLTGVK